MWRNVGSRGHLANLCRCSLCREQPSGHEHGGKAVGTFLHTFSGPRSDQKQASPALSEPLSLQGGLSRLMSLRLWGSCYGHACINRAFSQDSTPSRLPLFPVGLTK